MELVDSGRGGRVPGKEEGKRRKPLQLDTDGDGDRVEVGANKAGWGWMGTKAERVSSSPLNGIVMS